LDVYEPGPGSQIHDLNPTAFPPTGLFWTIEFPDADIKVNLGKGSATLAANNVPILDYVTLENAIFIGNEPEPTPGVVSFKVAWSGVNERLNIKNDDPVYGGFAGQFVRNRAQMEWTATVGDYQFVSAPLATSSSSFAEIGHERNGLFLPSSVKGGAAAAISSTTATLEELPERTFLPLVAN
jgi:hypothetical protein